MDPPFIEGPMREHVAALEDDLSQLLETREGKFAHVLSLWNASSDPSNGLHEQGEENKTCIRSLDRIPCCNIGRSQGTCPNNGGLSCIACRLVTYCSKKCQREHWHIYRKECKDSIRSTAWKPNYIVEGRAAEFLSECSGYGNLGDPIRNPNAVGIHFWDGIPALDLVNFSMNEIDPKRDLVLGLVASGDLRNVIRTVNSLPDDYTGHLRVILNDRQSWVVLHNIYFLLLLGTTAHSTKEVAKLALHFWYSAFVPSDYGLRAQAAYHAFVSVVKNDGSFTTSLGGQSTLSGLLAAEVYQLFQFMLSSEFEFSCKNARDTLNSVWLEPSRMNLHHHRYSRMEPSHRLACRRYREDGLVLPFGAPRDYFDSPNRMLFSTDGKWMQDDLADPLCGWDISEVVATGRTYGATREDIYGCLYFYISEQLQKFAERLRRFRISFFAFNMDASLLHQKIKSDALSKIGVPSAIRFDRIEVSNTFDTEFIGISRVATSWGPLLSSSPHATLLGWFVSWRRKQRDASLEAVPISVVVGVVKKVIEDGNIPLPDAGDKIVTPNSEGYLSAMIRHPQMFNSYYDNADAFAEYLSKHGILEMKHNVGLVLKDTHTIVPHRLYASLDSSPMSLPEFSDRENCYLRTCLGYTLWTEPFVEFGSQNSVLLKTAPPGLPPKGTASPTREDQGLPLNMVKLEVANEEPAKVTAKKTKKKKKKKKKGGIVASRETEEASDDDVEASVIESSGMIMPTLQVTPPSHTEEHKVRNADAVQSSTTSTTCVSIDDKGGPVVTEQVEQIGSKGLAPSSVLTLEAVTISLSLSDTEMTEDLMLDGSTLVDGWTTEGTFGSSDSGPHSRLGVESSEGSVFGYDSNIAESGLGERTEVRTSAAPKDQYLSQALTRTESVTIPDELAKSPLPKPELDDDRDDIDMPQMDPKPPEKSAVNVHGSRSFAQSRPVESSLRHSLPLEHSWTITFTTKTKIPPALAALVSPSSNGKSNKARIVLGQFNTVQSFARYCNWLIPPSDLECYSEYHLFKTGIKPVSQDDANVNGGQWVLTIKNNPDLLDRCWMSLVMALVGEELDEADHICGVIVSVWRTFSTIQLWTRSRDDISTINGIGERMMHLLEISSADDVDFQFQFNKAQIAIPPLSKIYSIRSSPAPLTSNHTDSLKLRKVNACSAPQNLDSCNNLVSECLQTSSLDQTKSEEDKPLDEKASHDSLVAALYSLLC